jgi:hypothetical protein
MAWSSLKNSLSSKPMVLAGPILRKVTPTSVTVWVATQVSASVTLTVADDRDIPVMMGARETVAVGKNLHIVAVTAQLLREDRKLTEGVVYQYDLAFDLGNRSMGLVDATEGARLAYPPLKRPSFALPPADLNSLRLLQGSCRMPHAEGKDTMPLIDDLIAATATNAFARPHQLLLTGDQIYADDVSDALLMTLIDAADALLGWQEVIPGLSDPKFRPPIPACLRYTNLGFPDMGKLQHTPGFTSEDLQSHLMSLGEYLSMYIFVWSEVLWPSALPTFDEVAAEVYKFIPRDAVWAYKPLVDLERKRIQKKTRSVDEFYQTLTKVRCALANIPTYMIFDDHEVTDDWNMTRDFCSSVYSHPLGLRIVQNALTAYALCQHWGNAPEQFDATSKPGRTLLDLFDPPMSRPPGAPRDFTNFAAKYDQSSAIIRKLLGVQDDSALKQSPHSLFHDPNSLQYHFTVEGTGHQIIFTDTRTWRSFPRGGNEASELLPEARLKDQILGTPRLENRALLVVLSTNAPAVQPIRSAARHAGIARAVRHYPDVYEAWEIPSVPFDRLLTVLTDKLRDPTTGQCNGRAILLSGDVHISFASRLIYRATVRFEDLQPQPATAVIAQLVASSFKKETEETRGFQKDGYTHAPAIAHLADFIPPHQPEGYVGWNVPAGTRLNDVGSKTFQEGGAPTNIRFEGPTLALWEESKLRYSFTLRRAPDYRYRLDYLTPISQDLENTPPPKIPLLLPGATPTERKQAAQAYKAAHSHYLLDNRTPGKEKIIGVNNFSEITFDWGQGDNKAVRHTLRWYWGTGSIFTTYKVSLDLDPKNTKFPDIPDGSNP